VDAQVTESLKAIGMENIRCAQTPGMTTVSFENNVYRSTYTGVGKAIDTCLRSKTKGDLQLVVLENRIPRLCINLPDTLTEAYRNGEINLTQVYQQMGITVDTDPAMKALKNAGQEEVPSAWKVDLMIYPDLFLENNTFDELYTYAINLNPAVEMALWKGGKYQDRALEHLDLIERIDAEVQGLSGEGFNCFMLVESVTDHDHERVQHDEECFVTHATDTSAVKPQAVAVGVTLVRG
jgi:hypothetical protein